MEYPVQSKRNGRRGFDANVYGMADVVALGTEARRRPANEHIQFR